MSLLATTCQTFGTFDLRRVAHLTSWIAVAGTLTLGALGVVATVGPAHSWLATAGLVAWIVSCLALYVSMRAEAAVITRFEEHVAPCTWHTAPTWHEAPGTWH